MTIAELHGKLKLGNPGGVHDRMEDLLTSDVFGTMQYVGWEHGFIDWLRSAEKPFRPFSTAEKANIIPRADMVRDIRYEFWPRRFEQNVEPDLLLEIQLEGRAIVLVMIECKYFSGPSDLEEESNVDEADARPSRQLGRQVNALLKLTPPEGAEIIKRVHLYITAHSTYPLDVYKAAEKEMREQESQFYWLSWRSLPKFLEQGLKKLSKKDKRTKEALSDLHKLMMHKRLFPYRGFTKLQPFLIDQFPIPSFWIRKHWFQFDVASFEQTSRFWRDKHERCKGPRFFHPGRSKLST